MSRLLVACLVLGCASATAAAPRWTWAHPTPTGAPLAAVHGSGARWIAVGERGTVLGSRDGGVTWRTLDAGTTADLRAVAVTDTLAIAVGERGTILRSRDGVTLDTRASGTTQPLVAVAIAGPTVFAVAADGSLVRSRDAGETFEALRGVPGATTVALGAAGIFLGGGGGLHRSTDGGATFVRELDEAVQGVVVAGDVVYALAGATIEYASVDTCGTCTSSSYERVALYRSTDRGATWQRRTLVDPTTTARTWGPPVAPVPPPTPPVRFSHRGHQPPFVRAPWGSRPFALGPAGELYVGTDQLLVSRDRGASFTTLAPPRAGTLGVTRGTLVAAGPGLVISRDGGATWREPGARVLGTNLFAITATPSGRVLAAGLDGALIARDPGGAWRRVALPVGARQRLDAIHALDDRHVIVVGERGVILQSRDGGATFQHRASDVSDDLSTVWGAGADVYAAGREVLLHSRDRGATWRSRPAPWYAARAIAGAGGTLYVAGDGVYRSDDGGVTWKELAPSPRLRGFSAIWADATTVVATGIEGTIAVSTDRGATWTERASGTRLDLRAIWGRGRELFVAGGDGYDGVVLHSADHGATWREEPVPMAVPAFGVTGTRDAVYVLGQGAAILKR